MAAINPADLRDYPFNYKSSRALNDVLVGEDTAIPLFNASSTGDVTTLRVILEQSPEIALESPHRIYQEDRPANDENDVRDVMAMKRANLDRAILQAAESGHATTVSTLLEFASRNRIKLSSVIDRETIKRTIENGHAAVFEVLVKAEPTIAAFDVIQSRRPLDLAIAQDKTEVAKVILEHGGGSEFPISHHTSSYRNSRLCQAAKSSNATMTELLIKHGYAVNGSGALQMAAERGALNIIRLLVEKHGADVNEQLPAETLPRVDNALFASWTPMHFAARWNREEAMKLLESYGANTDVLDANGKTAWQLLKERREASNQ